MRDYNIIFEYLYWIRDFFGGFISENLVLLQLISLLFSGLFLLGFVYILIRVSYLDMKTEEFMNLLGAGELSKRRSLKGWKQIQKRLLSEDSQQWKIAILEADKILDEILKMSGYLGKMDEKLNLITSAQLNNIEDVKIAHKICNQIIQEPAFEINQELATQTLNTYKKSFLELKLLRD